MQEPKMRTTRGRLCRLLMLLLLPAAIGCNNPIWYYSPSLGLKLGEDENKPVLLYFRAWDSTQHRNMVKNVFGNAEVKKELLDTINVEVEFAFFDSHKKRFGVQKPQVCVMCKPGGDQAAANMYVNPVPSVPNFLEWLRQAKSMAGPPADAQPNQPVQPVGPSE